MNTQEATEIVGTVLANWPDPPVTDLVTEAWLEAIVPLDYAQARDAVKELVQDRQWRPTPNEVVALVRRPDARVLDFKPRPVEGVLAPEESLARLRALKQAYPSSRKPTEEAQ